MRNLYLALVFRKPSSVTAGGRDRLFFSMNEAMLKGDHGYSIVESIPPELLLTETDASDQYGKPFAKTVRTLKNAIPRIARQNRPQCEDGLFNGRNHSGVSSSFQLSLGISTEHLTGASIIGFHFWFLKPCKTRQKLID
ncbi:MAG: hypothetical protein OXD44_02860 [Gammaproteobacteria bacterium]|nr:hypothetical protein [Gammaproteobacteria bacterium]